MFHNLMYDLRLAALVGLALFACGLDPNINLLDRRCNP